MIETKFRQLYLCDYYVDEESELLFNLAKEYHERCDDFDSKLVPYYAYWGISNKHAISVHRELRGRHPYISREKLWKAISHYPHNI